MRIALLGIDDTTLALAAAAVHNGHDEIALVDASASRAAEATAIAPAAQLISDWELALDSNALDAVLVAADQPAGNQANLRIEQLRRLIQVGMPALVSHPVSLSMLECYELEMIREESRSLVLPYLPARWHPAAEKLQSLVEQGTSSLLGPIEQIVLERFLPRRNRESVLRQFAVDADLLQFLAGAATKLHALGSASGKTTAGPYANLTVQMTCDRDLICRWTVSPVENQSSGRVTLIGAHGKAVFWMPAHSLTPASQQPWRLEVLSTGESAGVTAAVAQPKTEEYTHWDAAATALVKLAAACDGDQVDPTWAEAARTVELAETIDRSLARGRTIDLHHEEFTDIGTFKGTMTSVGCGLLVGGLVLVVLVAMVHLLAVQAGWNQLAAKLDNWPYLLLAVCAIYLLLQPLVFIGKPRQKTKAFLPNEKTGRGEGQTG